ncbi:MAG: hypothetical protein RLZZ60_702 [Bacteroidota bacterium]|jgi:hypothetical protein
MKFIHYLEHISGVSIYPLTSLIIFFVFFLALIWYVLGTDKSYIHSISELPLDKQENK